MPKFTKAERLCNAIDINHLFSVGHSISQFPVKIKWLPAKWNNNVQIKVVISVSKHRFKRAVDRNRIKRVMRECFRNNKHIIQHTLDTRQCYIAIIYTGKEIADYTTLEPIIIELFHRLTKEYEKLAG
jgi:ribonuclease P protein component